MSELKGEDEDENDVYLQYAFMEAYPPASQYLKSKDQYKVYPVKERDIGVTNHFESSIINLMIFFILNDLDIYFLESYICFQDKNEFILHKVQNPFSHLSLIGDFIHDFSKNIKKGFFDRETFNKILDLRKEYAMRDMVNFLNGLNEIKFSYLKNIKEVLDCYKSLLKIITTKSTQPEMSISRLQEICMYFKNNISISTSDSETIIQCQLDDCRKTFILSHFKPDYKPFAFPDAIRPELTENTFIKEYSPHVETMRKMDAGNGPSNPVAQRHADLLMLSLNGEKHVGEQHVGEQHVEKNQGIPYKRTCIFGDIAFHAIWIDINRSYNAQFEIISPENLGAGADADASLLIQRLNGHLSTDDHSFKNVSITNMIKLYNEIRNFLDTYTSRGVLGELKKQILCISSFIKSVFGDYGLSATSMVALKEMIYEDDYIYNVEHILRANTILENPDKLKKIVGLSNDYILGGMLNSLFSAVDYSTTQDEILNFFLQCSFYTINYSHTYGIKGSCGLTFASKTADRLTVLLYNLYREGRGFSNLFQGTGQEDLNQQSLNLISRAGIKYFREKEYDFDNLLGYLLFIINQSDIEISSFSMTYTYTLPNSNPETINVNNMIDLIIKVYEFANEHNIITVPRDIWLMEMYFSYIETMRFHEVLTAFLSDIDNCKNLIEKIWSVDLLQTDDEFIRIRVENDSKKLRNISETITAVAFGRLVDDVKTSPEKASPEKASPEKASPEKAIEYNFFFKTLSKDMFKKTDPNNTTMQLKSYSNIWSDAITRKSGTETGTVREEEKETETVTEEEMVTKDETEMVTGMVTGTGTGTGTEYLSRIKRPNKDFDSSSEDSLSEDSLSVPSLIKTFSDKSYFDTEGHPPFKRGNYQKKGGKTLKKRRRKKKPRSSRKLKLKLKDKNNNKSKKNIYIPENKYKTSKKKK